MMMLEVWMQKSVLFSNANELMCSHRSKRDPFLRVNRALVEDSFRVTVLQAARVLPSVFGPCLCRPPGPWPLLLTLIPPVARLLPHTAM